MAKVKFKWFAHETNNFTESIQEFAHQSEFTIVIDKFVRKIGAKIAAATGTNPAFWATQNNWSRHYDGYDEDTKEVFWLVYLEPCYPIGHMIVKEKA